MTKITFIQADGTQHFADAPEGTSVMYAAVSNDIPGIIAECGGSAMCATCHVYVDPAFVDKIQPISEVEIDMLDSASSERLENSRLSCQLIMDGSLETLVVHIPLHQI